MVEFRTGNLFDAETEVEALVNTVNTDGFMGKGIAREFKRRFPVEYFDHYERAVRSGHIDIGKLLVWDITVRRLDSPLRVIIDFPTKRSWRGKSRIEWVAEGLVDLRRVIERLEIRSIALPALGCGQGGLAWPEVAALIDRMLADVDAHVLAYGPPLPKPPLSAITPGHTTPGRAPVNYEPMMCRVCGKTIDPDLNVLVRLGSRRAAATRDDCIYRCGCGASYSNASSPGARVLITASPDLNVPEPVRSGVTTALERAVNETNLVNKRLKFCFETSEDAVTWTVLNGLQQAGRLGATVASAPDGEPDLLLWGAALAEGRATRVATELRRVSLELGEDSRRLTEPDAILSWDELLVFVEAKYRSPNDKKPSYGNFTLYTSGRPDLFKLAPDEVAATGYYELTRNWRIGVEVAERLGSHQFLLVNLGGKGLADSATEFAATIQQTPARRFCHRRWAEVLEMASPLEPWLAEYAMTRRLDAR